MWLRRLSIPPVMAALSCSVIAGLKDGELAPDGGAATGGNGQSGSGGSAGAGASGGMSTGGGGGAAGGSGTGGAGTGGTGTGGTGTGGGNYAAVVLADKPLGYWRLGEKSGTTAADSSGNGNDGVIKGTTALGEQGALTGDADTAYYFDGGASSYVDFGDTLDFSGKAPFTIEGWVYPQTKGRGFFGKVGYGTDYQGYFIAEGGGALQFYREATICAWTSNILPETRYSYIAGTFDGINWVLYVDGKQVATKVATNSVSDVTNPFTIGHVYQWNTMVGWIDEVAVYDKALGAARITAHYNAGMVK